MNANLDSSQREAVCCSLRPCEVIAGPGSGKTLVLTERIHYLIDHEKIDPSRILVLTFSRAAAAEMKDRFIKRDKERKRGVLFGTFHSVFFHILKESTQIDYALLGQAQKEKLLRQLLRNHFPDPDSRPTLEEAEKALRSRSAVLPENESFPALRKDYRTFLRENHYIDFDDMILECSRLLRENAEARRYWRDRFRAVLVDEFQDINAEQYGILKLLTSGEGLFVVGDDDQSIYGFRGSDPSIMEQFMADYRDADRIFLRSNYRCSGAICKASTMMIRANKMRIDKHVRAVRPAGSKTVLRGFADEAGEYLYLLRSIEALPEKMRESTAVIVRTNTHAVRISDYLTSHGILCGGQTGPSRQILAVITRDLQAYCELMKGMRAGLLSRESLYRVMNRPERYILRSIASQEYQSPQSLLSLAASNRGSVSSLSDLFHDLTVLGTMDAEGFTRYLLYAVGYGEWAASHLGNREAVQSALSVILRESTLCRDPEMLIRRLQQSAVSEGSAQGSGYRHNGSSAQGVSSGHSVDSQSSKSSAVPARGVKIMTMHACKGLEFDCVFLPALNEGVIPVRRCRTPADFEEERRLLYVAMTRARSRLELLYVRGTRLNPRPPSRFLSVYGVRSFVSD